VGGSREKFIKLAESRVNRAVDHIKLVGNLSNKVNYEYGEKDVASILRALNQAVMEIKSRFSTNGSEDTVKFKLEE